MSVLLLTSSQVADMAMIPLKDARARLYQLTANDYIQLQEVPKSADHSPHHTFYFFGVRLEQAFLRLRGELIKTMKNLKLRLRFEQARAKEELSRPELPVEVRPRIVLFLCIEICSREKLSCQLMSKRS
jgi:DNA-directed RNA polymerase III subunit RPC3